MLWESHFSLLPEVPNELKTRLQERLTLGAHYNPSVIRELHDSIQVRIAFVIVTGYGC